MAEDDHFGDYRARTDIRDAFYAAMLNEGAGREKEHVRRGLLAALRQMRDLLDRVEWEKVHDRDRFFTGVRKQTERFRELRDEVGGMVPSQVEDAMDEIVLHLEDVREDPPREPGYGKTEEDVLHRRFRPVEGLLDDIIDVLSHYSK